MRRLLVVVDMQHDFIDGSLGTKEAQEIVSNVITKINQFDGTVVYTRDTHDENYLSTQEGKKLPMKHCIKGTKGWEIPFEILDAGYEKRAASVLKSIYDKPTFGCVELAEDISKWYAQELEEDLEIELIGLCTDICVVSNALLLKAFLPSVSISVDSKCCAGVTLESHNAALETLRACQVTVIE